MWRLLITSGVQQGRAFRLRAGVNRVGRSTENDFQIPDSSVSGAHCELVYSDTGVLLRDLNSTNGTTIDGLRIHEATLALGQVFQIGNIELRLEQVADAAESVPVHIPRLEAPPRATSVVLADGSLACAFHEGTTALYHCRQCGQGLCPACVRVMRRPSGAALVFCALCNGQCDSFALAEAEEPLSPKRTILQRLAETLKLPFKLG